MTEMPTWEGFMIPVLEVLSDGRARHRREIYAPCADVVGLSDEQRTEVLPSSGEPLYQNRVGWAVSRLSNVGALTRPKRAHYQITDAGRQLLSHFPKGVTQHDLDSLGKDPRSPITAYTPARSRAVAAGTGTGSLADVPDAVPAGTMTAQSMTPIEQVQDGIERIRADVADDLLTRLQGKDPGFFESAVVKLLVAMGYGGTDGAGRVTQLSNDGGIDGIIDQDVLGLNRVYIQAKRYADDNAVQRPELQAFVGALSGKADRGVFITTSRFSQGAAAYAESVPTRIILIDGRRLTDLMIRYGVGIQVSETYTIPEIDEDFFA